MATQITNEQKYIITRGQLQLELNSISDQLSALEQRRDELQDLLYARPEITVEQVPAKKKAVVKKRVVTQKGTSRTVVHDPDMERLLSIVVTNPGVSRAGIRAELSDLDEYTLKRLMENASKRKLIKNKGSRAVSKWHIA